MPKPTHRQINSEMRAEVAEAWNRFVDEMEEPMDRSKLAVQVALFVLMRGGTAAAEEALTEFLEWRRAGCKDLWKKGQA